MDKKAILAAATGVLVTLLVTGVLSWIFGVFEAGSDALTEKQIKAVMEERLAKLGEADEGIDAIAHRFNSKRLRDGQISDNED